MLRKLRMEATYMIFLYGVYFIWGLFYMGSILNEIYLICDITKPRVKMVFFRGWGQAPFRPELTA